MNEKWLYWPEKFPGVSRNGPLGRVGHLSQNTDTHREHSLMINAAQHALRKTANSQGKGDRKKQPLL